MDATFTPEQGPVRIDMADDLEAYGEAVGRSLVHMYAVRQMPGRTNG